MKACKFVVSPSSQRHASGEAYKTQRHEHPMSQRGWRDAVRQAKSGSASGEASTIFLACARGDIRIADCSGVENSCRMSPEIGGSSTRVLASADTTKPPPRYHVPKGPPPGVPILPGMRGGRRGRR